MNENDFKLCYLEKHKAYFTDNFEHQWGDDWNDSPYEDNAGEPYDSYTEDGITHDINIITIFFDTNDYWYERQPCDIGRYSVEQINRGAVAWIDTEQYSIPAGTTLKKFKEIIKKHGGSIYIKEE